MRIETQPVNAIGQFNESRRQELFPHPKRVFSAGDNANRFEWLKMCFPHEECIVLQYDVNKQTGVDTEPKDLSQERVMEHKLSVALGGYNLRTPEELWFINKSRSFGENGELRPYEDIYNPQYNTEGDLIVGVDSRTYIPKKEGEWESVGKPESLEEVQGHFQEILKIAKQTNTIPEYEVKSASGVVYIDEELNPHYVKKKNSCKIFLNTEKLQELITNEGFQEYVNKADAFFGSQNKIMDKSAGFSLEVLVQMGVVSGLQFPGEGASQRGEETFRNTLKRAIQLVAIGTAPELMGLFENVDPTSVVDTWDFLEREVGRTLGEM